jgi:GDPmannose 4,6-dehydratase
MKKALIIGVSGQDGSYLARFLLKKGYHVIGTSRGDTTTHSNLLKVGVHRDVDAVKLDPSSYEDLNSLLKEARPDEVYNLAGQTSVGRSFEEPFETFRSIAENTMILLEVLRKHLPQARLFQAGSGEVFCETPTPATEITPYNPVSPYSVAKVAAQAAVKVYREAYGLHASTGILFNHESPIRPQRFVTSKIVSTAVRIAGGSKETLHLGKIDLYRDWGWAPDYVEAMWQMLQHEKADDYVIATGEEHSIEDFVATTFMKLGLDWRDHVKSDPNLFRPSDIEHSVGDSSKAKRVLGWEAKLKFDQIIKMLVEAEVAKSTK